MKSDESVQLLGLYSEYSDRGTSFWPKPKKDKPHHDNSLQISISETHIGS